MTELLLAAGGVKKEEVPTPPGTYWPEQGGYYAGLIRVGSDIYALVVAPKALGGEAPGTLAWKTSNTSTAGTDSVNDGWANTQAMATAGLASHPAAQFCRGLTIGGYSDWYLPAKDELEILYRNFKPTTQSNNISYGANSSSIPPQGNYTSGNPAQTSIALFKEGGAEAITTANYWSSTEYSSSNCWYQSFINGYQYYNGNKGNARSVRAVRRVKVEIPDPPASVGAPYGGGYYAGRIWHWDGLHVLVVAPKSLGGEASGTLTWKTSQTTTAGADSVNDGWANTQAMATAGLANHPAAQFCRGLTIGGFNDWYLPAKDELEILYRNFKPTTHANHASYGANSSSVPPQGNYTLGNPAQTSIALFKAGGAEAFASNQYWPSTEYNSAGGWYQVFNNGYQNFRNKTDTYYVRAVRRVRQPIYVAKD